MILDQSTCHLFRWGGSPASATGRKGHDHPLLTPVCGGGAGKRTAVEPLRYCAPSTALPPSFEHRSGRFVGRPGARWGRGVAVRHRTRNPVPAPKFARSLTRCTEISEENVMDVAHGEMVEAELTPVGAKRTTWRGARVPPRTDRTPQDRREAPE